MPSILRSPVVALGLVLIPVLSVPAQERPKPPVFKARTEVVLVDFVVSDKADRLVRDLAAKDFVVKEDGKDRPVVSFVEVRTKGLQVRARRGYFDGASAGR